MTGSILNPSTCCLLATLLVASAAFAAGKDDAGGTLGLYLENDLFAGTDEHYTSGFKLSWSSRDLEQYSDSRYASPFLPVFNVRCYNPTRWDSPFGWLSRDHRKTLCVDAEVSVRC